MTKAKSLLHFSPNNLYLYLTGSPWGRTLCWNLEVMSPPCSTVHASVCLLLLHLLCLARTFQTLHVRSLFPACLVCIHVDYTSKGTMWRCMTRELEHSTVWPLRGLPPSTNPSPSSLFWIVQKRNVPVVPQTNPSCQLQFQQLNKKKKKSYQPDIPLTIWSYYTSVVWTFWEDCVVFLLWSFFTVTCFS